VAGDDALLSPAHGRDSAYVAVHLFEGMDWQPAFREVEALMGTYGGHLASRYPRWEAFQAARAELDPDGKFENDWTRSVLGRRRSIR
jgi:L-gulonolactone oxidase